MKVVREASYIEEIDVVVSAPNKEKASEIAEAFGNGNIRDWPDIQRYTVGLRHAQEYETLKVTHDENTEHAR